MKLKLVRLQHEITQIDLEVLTGIPAQRLSLIERGYRQPTLIEKIKIADAFKLDVDSIEYPQINLKKIRLNMETSIGASMGQDCR